MSYLEKQSDIKEITKKVVEGLTPVAQRFGGSILGTMGGMGTGMYLSRGDRKTKADFERKLEEDPDSITGDEYAAYQEAVEDANDTLLATTATGALGGLGAHMGYNRYKSGSDREKQAFAGLVGAGVGGLVGAANLPDDASPHERARMATRGAIRGGGIGSGMFAGGTLGELGRRMLLDGQKNPSSTRQIIATLLPMLGGGLGSYAGYEIADEFARNPALGYDSEPDAGDKAKAEKREERMEKEKQGSDGAPLTEAQLAQNNYYGYSVPRNLNQLYNKPGVTLGQKQYVEEERPSVWDYLKSPIKNLATGGRYTQEKNMSRVYDQTYSPDLQKGPKPAAGNSTRKAIKPMENNPMGGYSTPTQGVLTPYPRKKQGADSILSSMFVDEEKIKQEEEQAKLDRAVARNLRERMARRIAKEKTAVDAVLKSLVLEKIAESAAWQRKAGKNSEGGLNAKGRASYNKATGGNLKAPVTSKKPKGKAKKRKASFCARMGGMKKKNTSKATANDPDSRINKSLRKWNC